MMKGGEKEEDFSRDSQQIIIYVTDQPIPHLVDERGDEGMNDIEDIFNDPSSLEGKTPLDIRKIIENAYASGHCEKGTLRRGSRRGMGMVLREVMPNGNYTGRMLQWHPGGGHHGAPPYWKVSSPTRGTIRLGHNSNQIKSERE